MKLLLGIGGVSKNDYQRQIRGIHSKMINMTYGFFSDEKDTDSEFSCLLLWQKKIVAKIITINILNNIQIKKENILGYILQTHMDRHKV